ncbi:MAG: hypothetical protein ACOX7R_11315 [Acetivibrionales bacterium]|jgi:hypothetical protein
MSEDLNKTIKQMAETLGKDGMADNLKNLLSLFANSASAENSKSNEQNKEQEDKKDSNNALTDNMDMMRTVSKIMSRLDSINDPRINLLYAVKPFLSNKRQNKLNNCVNILRMSSLVRMIEEDEKGS